MQVREVDAFGRELYYPLAGDSNLIQISMETRTHGAGGPRDGWKGWKGFSKRKELAKKCT